MEENTEVLLNDLALRAVAVRQWEEATRLLKGTSDPNLRSTGKPAFSSAPPGACWLTSIALGSL